MTPTQKTALLRLYGLGSLSEATRENWPWWKSVYVDAPIPRMPDLLSPTAEADAAAVKVAERMGNGRTQCLAVRDGEWVVPYSDAVHDGPTLGQALLAALPVQR